MKFCPALNRSCERIDCYDGPACIIERPRDYSRGFCFECGNEITSTGTLLSEEYCVKCKKRVNLVPVPKDWNRDPVNHPDHYGGDTVYEVIKVIEAWGLDNDFCLGNTVKYIARAGKKGEENGKIDIKYILTDLKKALWYLERKIKNLENANRTDKQYGDA